MKPLASDFATMGLAYLGTPYDSMDCQAFVERCLELVGIHLDLKGSNAWFRRMSWTGTPEECIKTFGRIPSGAFLFIVDHNGGEVARGYHDGLGNASHIGIKTGINGSGRGAIHSSESKGVVCESFFADKTIRNGGWNTIGLWINLDYGDSINALLEKNASEPGKEKNIEVTIKMEKAIIRTANGGGVNLRADTRTDATRIRKIPEGSEVEILQWGDVWSQISYGDKQGYAMSQYLERESVVVCLSRSTAESMFDALKASLYGGDV